MSSCGISTHQGAYINVEVTTLRNKALDLKPLMEWGLNRHSNVVPKETLGNSSDGPSFTTTFPGGTKGKKWKSWWGVNILIR